MKKTFDYDRAKAFARSGSRSDLMAGRLSLFARFKGRLWLLIVPIVVFGLALTIIIGRNQARDSMPVENLLTADTREGLEERVTPASQLFSCNNAALAVDLRQHTDSNLLNESAAAILSKDIVVKSGDTLLDLLVREGVARDQAHDVVGALTPVFNPRQLKNQQALTMTYEAPDDDSFEFKSLNIKLDPEHEVRVERCETKGFTANEIVNEFDTRTLRASFEINSSLYEASIQNDVPFDMLIPIINVYAYDVDFQRDIRSGDHFEIMYEIKVNADGEVVCSGTTSYAALTTQGHRFTLYQYRDTNGAVDYFDEQGRSLKKNLMVTPVDGARISSRYGKRKHPILGYSRMHRGLDFAAPRGTPIKAAGDGVVEFAAYGRTFGNNVRLRHANSYKTRYAHMSRIAKGIRNGVRVKQGQIIGYIGSTGMSTGPHLHYEVYYQGKSINPTRIKSKPGRILKGNELERFMEAKAVLDVQFASLKEPAVFAQIAQPEA